MNINISSGVISYTTEQINSEKKLLVLGKGNSISKAREIHRVNNLDEAYSYYGNSELYNAYKLLNELDVKNIYLCNCFAESDYIRIIDTLLHYDFDYLIPIGLYLSDQFYNPITDRQEYYFSYFLEQFSTVNSLTTIIATERHASLYEDFDDYTFSMQDIEREFFLYHELNNKKLLEEYGNNLNFIYNNLETIPYANLVLGALYCNRDYANYFGEIVDLDVVYNLDSIDMVNLKAMYFKYNFYNNNITIENPFNFKTTNDIYSNALIDDVIKRVIRQIDMSEYKGKLFNPYVPAQIESKINKKMKKLKGSLFKSYSIKDVSFVKTDISSGYILIKFNIVPYGTVENINIIMGVV